MNRPPDLPDPPRRRHRAGSLRLRKNRRYARYVGFELDGYYYEPMKGQVAKYMLYGLLPDNKFVYGKQYTFHIGLDLSSVYHEITFAPSVGA